MTEVQNEFWLNERVEVVDPASYFSGTKSIIVSTGLNNADCEIYEIYTKDGARWFAANQLEHVVDPRDSEIERLRTALKETERQRDIAYAEFSDVYQAMDKLAVMFVDAGIVPQSALDEFRNEVAVYKPLLDAPKALQSIERQE